MSRNHWVWYWVTVGVAALVMGGGVALALTAQNNAEDNAKEYRECLESGRQDC